MSDESEKDCNHIDLADVIKIILAKPRLYVDSCEFRTVSAFIEGYASASRIQSSELKEFGFWLGRKLGLRPNVMWSCNLIKKYPDDETALERLPVLFGEFREDKRNGWSFKREFAREMERIMAEGELHNSERAASGADE